jgi:protein SCO1/2
MERVLARVHLALIALAACLLAAVVGVALASRGGGRDGGLSVTHGWAGSLRPAAARVPPFRLRDQSGRIVDSAALRGRPVVYAFVYSTCRDVCPAQVQTIRGALDRLGRDVTVLGVSVDPRGDTATRAATFLLKQNMTGRMRFLLGSRAQLAPVWRAFGIRPQTHALEHSAEVVLADARGAQRVGFPYDHLTVAALAHDLERLT